MALAAGDITRRDAILWGFTLEEARPYAEHRRREILFREAVIAFLIAEKDLPEERFCRACKATGKANCGSCDFFVEILDETGRTPSRH